MVIREYSDRYFQTSTLLQLGRVVQEQRLWEAAAQYGLEAATIFVEYEDQHNLGIVLHDLGEAWQATNKPSIPQKLSELLEMPVAEVEELLRKLLTVET